VLVGLWVVYSGWVGSNHLLDAREYVCSFIAVALLWVLNSCVVVVLCRNDFVAIFLADGWKAFVFSFTVHALADAPVGGVGDLVGG